MGPKPAQVPKEDSELVEAASISKKCRALIISNGEDYYTKRLYSVFLEKLNQLDEAIKAKSPDAFLAAKYLQNVLISAEALHSTYSQAWTTLNADVSAVTNEKNKLFMKQQLDALRVLVSDALLALADMLNQPASAALREVADQKAMKLKIAFDNAMVIDALFQNIEGVSVSDARTRCFNELDFLKRAVERNSDDKAKQEQQVKALKELESEFSNFSERLGDFKETAYMAQSFVFDPQGRLTVSDTNLHTLSYYSATASRANSSIEAAYNLAYLEFMKNYNDLEGSTYDRADLDRMIRSLESLTSQSVSWAQDLKEFKVPRLDHKNRPIFLDDGSPLLTTLEFKHGEMAEVIHARDLYRDGLQVLLDTLRSMREEGVYDTAKIRGLLTKQIRVINPKTGKFENYDGLAELKANYENVRDGIFNSNYGSYMAKMNKTDFEYWYEQVSLPVADACVLAAMFVPSGVTQAAGGAYFAIRAGMTGYMEYSSSGSVSWQTIAMGVAGLTGVGGGVIRVLGATSKTTRILSYSFAGAGAAAGAPLLVGGAVQLTKDIKDVIKLGWRDDRAVSLISGTVMLGLGATGLVHAARVFKSKGLPQPKPVQAKETTPTVKAKEATPSKPSVGEKIAKPLERATDDLFAEPDLSVQQLYAGWDFVSPILRGIKRGVQKTWPKVKELAKAREIVDTVGEANAEQSTGYTGLRGRLRALRARLDAAELEIISKSKSKRAKELSSKIKQTEQEIADIDAALNETPKPGQKPLSQEKVLEFKKNKRGLEAERDALKGQLKDIRDGLDPALGKQLAELDMLRVKIDEIRRALDAIADARLPEQMGKPQPVPGPLGAREAYMKGFLNQLNSAMDNVLSSLSQMEKILAGANLSDLNAVSLSTLTARLEQAKVALDSSLSGVDAILNNIPGFPSKYYKGLPTYQRIPICILIWVSVATAASVGAYGGYKGITWVVGSLSSDEETDAAQRLWGSSSGGQGQTAQPAQPVQQTTWDKWVIGVKDSNIYKQGKITDSDIQSVKQEVGDNPTEAQLRAAWDNLKKKKGL